MSSRALKKKPHIEAHACGSLERARQAFARAASRCMPEHAGPQSNAGPGGARGRPQESEAPVAFTAGVATQAVFTQDHRRACARRRSHAPLRTRERGLCRQQHPPPRPGPPPLPPSHDHWRWCMTTCVIGCVVRQRWYVIRDTWCILIMTTDHGYVACDM